MRKSWAIALNRFRVTLRSKAALATMFGMPLSFILIFGLLLGGNPSSATPQGVTYPVAVIDQDHSFLSRQLIERVAQAPNLRLYEVDRAELDRLIANSRVVGGLTIPAGFQAAIGQGDEPLLHLITTPGTNLDAGVLPILNRLLQQVAGEYQLASQLTGAVDGVALEEGLARVASLRERVGSRLVVESMAAPLAKQEGQSPLNTAALGFTVMGVMMWTLLMAGTMLEERQHGTWGRLLTTPSNRGGLLLGFLLAFWLTGLFQFSLLVGLTRYLLGVVWGPLLPLLAVAAAMILAAGGIGLFLAGLIRSHEQQQTIGVVVVIATSMLGGLFWPLDLVSPALQRIGYLTPQAWAMEGLTEVALRGGGWAGVGLPIAVLAGMGLVFTTAGVLRVRFE